MSVLPKFAATLDVKLGDRLRLMLCSEELSARYSHPVWLCGSGLITETPIDWDVRVTVPRSEFSRYDLHYWANEGALRTAEQRHINHLNFDVRFVPADSWYEMEAVRLDCYAPHEPLAFTPSAPATVEDVEENKRIIDRNKDKPEFHVLLGTLIYNRGDKKTALQAFLRAVQLDPKCWAAWLNMGNIFYDWGEFKKAAVYYRRALVVKPDYVKAYCNMGNVLAQLAMHKAALPFYDKAIELEPGMVQAHHNKASCLTNLQKYAYAEREIWKAIDLDPQDDKALNTLGNLRVSQGMEYAAAGAYRTAILANPKYAPLYTNLANVYMNLGRSKEAIVNYERGLILDSKNPGVRYNLALAYLRDGQYLRGWKAYEGRWGFRELATKKRDFAQPQWSSESVEGRRILIHAEQGLGDTIQFCRYVPLVAALGGIVYFEVQHGLQRLMATVPGVSRICTRGLPLPEFDLHCPLMSMPAIFRTDLHTVPGPVPYLHAWEWETVELRKRFPSDGRLRIGLSWAGNPKYKKDKERSFSLAEFYALSGVDGVSFYSLQKGPAARQIDKYREQLAVVDASSDCRDFAETAALIATMDLVIASDSSPMHLAAAMGKEVWLLLACLPDWRWMESGETTPWYPNVRIFRQTTAGDWRGVFDRVRRELEERTNECAAYQARQAGRNPGERSAVDGG